MLKKYIKTGLVSIIKIGIELKQILDKDMF